MNLNAIGRRPDAAAYPAGGGYGRVRDGLRTFDALGDAIRQRQDALRPAPAPGAAVATAGVGTALAAYLASEAGQKALGTFAHAVVDFAGRVFEDGPKQLPLPLA